MEQATENPGVGGSIPPLATKLLAMERQVFFNTDQGSQFTSAVWVNAIQSRDIRVSMVRVTGWITFSLSGCGGR